MGIRFDRDTKRATNGPVIFFSDAMSESAFSEEVKGAILSGLSFYSYRMPGDLMISFGSSEGYLNGIGVPGFVIGRFLPNLPYLTIPYKGIGKNSENDQGYRMPEESTSFEKYSNEVAGILSFLDKQDKSGKVVAARVMVKDEDIDPSHLFFRLLRTFPNAFVFCFSTPATGCWIGASPELLLKGKNGILETMALAGTREIGEDEPWDEKNIEEQVIVKDYIENIFRNNGLSPIEGETFSKEAGIIEHICTPVSAEILSGKKIDIEKFLHELSPTPALCGFPKEEALRIIEKYENFDRGCYGGFCGPYHSAKDFHFNVVLRCASFTEREICLYAGGGITSKSNVYNEWRETQLKFFDSF